MRVRDLVIAILLTVGLSPLQTGAAQPFAIGETLGEATFKDIRHVTRSLDDLGRKRAYVLVFANTTCPLVKKYLPRLKTLHETYRDREVEFVLVNVGLDDTIRDVASQALRNELHFPAVKDVDAALARKLGVERTPTAVVLDADRKLVYRGRIDDQYRIGGALPAPRRNDLEEALREVLDGKAVSTPTTPIDGCQITFPEAAAKADTKFTFAEHVAPLMREHCVRCHRAGTAAPFPLVTYEDVSSQGGMIAEVVSEQRMPPWYANPEHGEFQNDPRLKPEQRRTILDWVRGGMPAGDPARLPAADSVPAAPKWRIGEPDLVVTMLGTHTLPAEGLLPYEYIVFPHVFPRETWLEAIEIRPSNPRVVHHANLAFAAAGEKPGLDTFITGYVPGGQPMDLGHFDNHVAYRIPALSVLGLQIHYTTTGQPEECRFAVGLRFAKRPVQKRLRFNVLDTHRFRIPPHHPAFPVRDSFTLDEDATLLGFFTHMHVRGKDMTFLAHADDGTTETLLEIPNYNFEWQLGYEIEPGKKRLVKGTRVEALAHFDNSAFNPYNPDPTAEVRYGQQTHHEMMNGYVFYTFDSEELNLEIDPKTGGVVPQAR